MHIETLPLGALQTNCYLVSTDSGDAYVIDPGGDPERLLLRIEKLGLRPQAILLTHAHFDHIGAVPRAARELGVPVLLDSREIELYRSPRNAMLPWVPPITEVLPETVESLPAMPEGLAFRILKTPGHTPGGISFYFAAAAVVFTGDALFQGSIGRTDLPGSDSALLLRSIRGALFTLPDDTAVYPGHGDSTTIGDEKRYNPYLQ